MREDRSLLETVVAGCLLPFRYFCRAVGFLLAALLLLAVPVVLVAAFTSFWFTACLVLSLVVDLPVVLSDAVFPIGGVPAVVVGVPMLYPLGMGLLTTLVLGWPDPDYESDFDPPVLGR